MSNAEESCSSPEEGFSASEDEWMPSKETRGGDTSDDDDSDFECLPDSVGAATNKKKEPKGRSVVKQNAVKKRKSSMQSLRSKLYNKYKPPPKTIPRGYSNSPSASCSKRSEMASKNGAVPNDDSDKDDNSSLSSVDNYLVNPAELDLQSSFFDVGVQRADAPESPPFFDCNAGLRLSESDLEDDNESSEGDKAGDKAFDFRNLLEKATRLEGIKESIAKRAAATAEDTQQEKSVEYQKSRVHASAAMDVESLLALGENASNLLEDNKSGRQKLRQTKSTRQKRHPKIKPQISSGGAADSEDSDWEDVADDAGNHNSSKKSHDSSRTDHDLEIHVELPGKHRSSKDRKQQDIDAILKRKLNREIKERQLLLHKTSLLCCFARGYLCNRFLNDQVLMKKALKLLPSKNSYPPECGTSRKYYQSLVTWFKTAIKLKSDCFYPEKNTNGRKMDIKKHLNEQLEQREARCKQDMVFMFVILARGMGLQCRLVINMQPLPLRPAQTELCTIKLKKPEDQEGSHKKAIDKSEEKDNKSSNKQEVGRDNKVVHNKSVEEDNKAAKQKKNPVILKKPDDQEGHKKAVEKSEVKDNKSNKKQEVGKDKKGSHNKSVEEDNKAAKQKKIPVTLKKPDDQGDHKKATDKSEEKDKKSINKQDGGKDKKGSHNKSTEEDNKAAKQKKIPVVLKKPDDQEGGHKKATDKSEEKDNKSSNKQEVGKDKKGSHNKSVEEDNKTAKQKKIPITLKKPDDQGDHKKATDKSEEKDNKCSNKQEVVKDKKGSHNKSTEEDNKAAKQKKIPVVLKKPDDQEGGHKKATDKSEEKDNKSINNQERGKDKEIADNMSVESDKKAAKQKEKKEKTAKAKTESSLSLYNCARRSKSLSPKPCIVPQFLETKVFREKFSNCSNNALLNPNKRSKSKSPSPNKKARISPQLFSKNTTTTIEVTKPSRVLRSRLQKITQLDGVDDCIVTNNGDDDDDDGVPLRKRSRKPQLKKLKKILIKKRANDSGDDSDFEVSPKKPKVAPVLKTVERLIKDRRVLSTDDDDVDGSKRDITKAADTWVELWSEIEDLWICVDLVKGKLNAVDVVRKSATSNLAYVYAFQNDLSLKDVTARYCPHWTTMIRKSRVDKSWLDVAISKYLGHRTKRDMCEDLELRRIHEEKPMPTAISDYKDHPLYALERHLLKFQAIYPPDAPTLGFVRGEPVYPRDCVNTLHSREIWLKQARTVKMGEKAYKIVKARPKWDRLTQTIIKDQPLEVFGYWQTEDYEPPTAENGLVPRNAYGNVELFKACMLPKKTVHLKLPGLNRICKKLGIDCANAVIGFDFHQGACHPTYDGFVVCEEFGDQVTAAWYQDQEDQDRKEQEKYEARVYGNWKKLVRGLLIRERLKKKYNF